MRVITSPQKIQTLCINAKRSGRTIAVVPTMGYLHEGHLTLLRRARKKADVLVMTLFVNPTQFGPKEDLGRYPRDIKGDLAKAKREKVDFVFLPTRESIYPQGYETYVEVTRSSRELCGKSRPTHFRGVATVVLKLFNLINPDWAIFGLKDYQQFAVLCQMVKDLHLPIRMVGIPTVREKDGLAMSSRNAYLTESQRKAARCLSKGLFEIKREVKNGHTDLKAFLMKLKKTIRAEKLARVDYIECLDARTLTPLKGYSPGRTLFAVAVFFGKTRLIDNGVV